MEVSPLAAAESARQASQAGANAPFGGDAVMGENFDQFLLLLTTQLQNQDPLDPLDTAQFTQQLVGFAGVEQQIRTNQNLEYLTGLQAYNQLAAGVGLIGRWVEADGDGLTLDGGEAVGAYTIESEAENARVVITDANGKVVRRLTVPAGPGRHEFIWDGKDEAGRDLADGAYTFSINATDADGKPASAFTSTIGKVDGVETDENGLLLLKMGESKVPLSLIMRVHDIAT